MVKGLLFQLLMVVTLISCSESTTVNEKYSGNETSTIDSIQQTTQYNNTCFGDTKITNASELDLLIIIESQNQEIILDIYEIFTTHFDEQINDIDTIIAVEVLNQFEINIKVKLNNRSQKSFNYNFKTNEIISNVQQCWI